MHKSLLSGWKSSTHMCLHEEGNRHLPLPATHLSLQTKRSIPSSRTLNLPPALAKVHAGHRCPLNWPYYFSLNSVRPKNIVDDVGIRLRDAWDSPNGYLTSPPRKAPALKYSQNLWEGNKSINTAAEGLESLLTTRNSSSTLETEKHVQTSVQNSWQRNWESRNVFCYLKTFLQNNMQKTIETTTFMPINAVYNDGYTSSCRMKLQMLNTTVSHEVYWCTSS